MNYDEGRGSPVKGRRYGAISLLSRRVPELDLDESSVDDDGLFHEVEADRRRGHRGRAAEA